ncbi:MAG: glyoxalase [Alphaproteobacteria bacterium]|nr:glyoxalase [Alphaproteobacteria bacterium]
MLVTGLFHVNIKSANLDATRRFYVEVLGMQTVARPNTDFPGLWIKPALPGGDAIFHFHGGWAARDPDGSVPSGTAAIDHVSITASGYYAMHERLKKLGLTFWENKVPDLPLWQIFVHDPSGVLIEMAFDMQAEGGPPPEIASGRQYVPGQTRFNPAEYRQFVTD